MILKIPSFLSHLPVHAGFPVPVVMLWVDGKPDFRAVDAGRIIRCYERRECGICGRRLSDMSYFIGGDGCKGNHNFRDPAMHLNCANFSVEICPFLNGTREGYSERPLPNVPVSVRPAFVPENKYIMKSMTKWTKLLPEDGGGAVFQAGLWLSITKI